MIRGVGDAVDPKGGNEMANRKNWSGVRSQMCHHAGI